MERRESAISYYLLNLIIMLLFMQTKQKICLKREDVVRLNLLFYTFKMNNILGPLQ